MAYEVQQDHDQRVRSYTVQCQRKCAQDRGQGTAAPIRSTMWRKPWCAASPLWASAVALRRSFRIGAPWRSSIGRSWKRISGAFSERAKASCAGNCAAG